MVQESDAMAVNEDNLGINRFNEHSKTLVTELKRTYQRGINIELSKHQSEGVFARQVTTLVNNYLSAASKFFNDTGDNSQVFQGLGNDSIDWFLAQCGVDKDGLIDYALKFNRSSCALSNFPQEHNANGDYLHGVLSEIEKNWCLWCEQIKERALIAQISS